MADNVLTRKIGPLPTWGWTAIVGSVIVGWAWWKNRQTASSSSTSTGSTANASQVPQFVNQTYTTVTPPSAPSSTANDDDDTDKHPKRPKRRDAPASGGPANGSALNLTGGNGITSAVDKAAKKGPVHKKAPTRRPVRRG